jgi:hypothetical protein
MPAVLQRPHQLAIEAAGPDHQRREPASPDGLLDVYALSTEINSSRVEGIELLTPLHG